MVLQRMQKEGTRFISELKVEQVSNYDGCNGSWFDRVLIPLNGELTAIIGNKGSGKSALADILGLLGEARSHKYFSFLTIDQKNKKFRQKGYAENFIGTLSWESQAARTKRLDEIVDDLKPELVKYLPQNYFESVTNELEVKDFRSEIEKVVFSHVDVSARMGASSFSEMVQFLSAQSRQEISLIKGRLRELNFRIVELEQEADPASRTRLQQLLEQKEQELAALNDAMPENVPVPDPENQSQRSASAAISNLRSKQSEVATKLTQNRDVLVRTKSAVARLEKLRGSILAISARIEFDKNSLRDECKRFDLDIDAILPLHIQLDSIDAKIGALNDDLQRLETQVIRPISSETGPDELQCVSDLEVLHEKLSERLSVLQDELSAPQRKYQRYLGLVSEISARKEELTGSAENPAIDTISYLRERIRYLDEGIEVDLLRCREERNSLSRDIFEAKQVVLSFYDKLRLSVAERLKAINSDMFTVTIEAAFTPSLDMREEFLGFVNQTARGRFRGSAEGAAEFDRRQVDVNWNEVESVLTFVTTIVNDLRQDDIDRQVKDVKSLYDYLFSLEYFDARYELRLGGKSLNQLSPGEKGLLLLIFYLQLDKEKTPLIIDQPEDNLDNHSIFTVLANCIREAKKSRQVILVTHNPNLAVGADAEQIIFVSLDKASNYKFTYAVGAIENPQINDAIVNVLEGTKPAFVQRRLKYQIR